MRLPLAASAGFHEKTLRETPLRFQSAALHRNVELKAHRSRSLNQEQVDSADLIFAMDARNLRDLQREFPKVMNKALLLGALRKDADPGIPDPYDQSIGSGGKVYRRLDLELEELRGILDKAQ